MAAKTNYEQAGELKIGQVGIANLRIRTLDVAQLSKEMAERVQGAPKLFERAAVILDFGGLSECPAAATVTALVDGLRAAGVLPVAIASGTREIDALAREVGLPRLAKFRAAYEPIGGSAASTAPAPEPAPEPRPAPRLPPNPRLPRPPRRPRRRWAWCSWRRCVPASSSTPRTAT